MRCNRTVERIVAVISHALQHRKRPARVRTVPHQAHAQGTDHPETRAKIDALLNMMCAQECISLKANSSNSEVGAERAWPHAALAPIRIT